MKKSELRRIIREEITRLTEGVAHDAQMKQFIKMFGGRWVENSSIDESVFYWDESDSDIFGIEVEYTPEDYDTLYDGFTIRVIGKSYKPISGLDLSQVAAKIRKFERTGKI